MFFKKCFQKQKFRLSLKIQTRFKSENFLPFSKKKLVKLSSNEIFVRVHNLFLNFYLSTIWKTWWKYFRLNFSLVQINWRRERMFKKGILKSSIDRKIMNNSVVKNTRKNNQSCKHRINEIEFDFWRWWRLW